MLRKLLVANRGEIAARVIASARRLGIATVAIYSDADAGAKHVAMADEAVNVGPAPVAESYLRGARIVEAAVATGAEAIHPGYGFLSENPDFVEAVEAAGLVFVGPSASAIRAMGLKDAAKALMQAAGVPVVPGYHGDNQDPEFLAAQAEAIGYPVLIKARAGGGGKGMRMVTAPDEFVSALRSAQREGQASFADPVCLIEKYVNGPRHVEIQVFGDAHGNVLHLFERDCSLQRRHQKVIEEAPAPGMAPEVRAAMGKAAVDAARAIGYQGAGTVEFIADGSQGLRADRFWFMEMNTRLQVEHPVSEAITGLDFVELQLRVACGEALPVKGDTLCMTGHAFEARVYAEDAPRGFLPAIGRLEHLQFPDGVAFERGAVRIDSGVRRGDAISPYYDPMIAKIIVHGATRAIALNMLRRALAECHVVGCITNLSFLGALAAHPDFALGAVDTGLIARDLDALVAEPPPCLEVSAAAALCALGMLDPIGGGDPWQCLSGWRHWSADGQFAALERDGERIEARVLALGKQQFQVEVGEAAVRLSVAPLTGTRLELTCDGRKLSLDVVQVGARVTVFCEGRSYDYNLPDSLAEADEADAGGDAVIAPMPGLVTVVSVAVGETVEKGQPLLVLEAMKMEHTLSAPRAGVVAEILAELGDQVTDGTVLLTLVPERV